MNAGFMIRIVIAVSLVVGNQALAQQLNATPQIAEASPETNLPEAPPLQGPQTAPLKQDEARPASAVPPGAHRSYGPLPPLLTTASLTPHVQLIIYIHQAFGPPAVVLPAMSAAIRMANPPGHYPREWKDGAGAFGRLYGNVLATQTTLRTTKFVTDVALHEDPRYLPAPEGSNAAKRIVHAVGFTFVDRGASGDRRPAFANYASAAAAGFVGMAYLPTGYNDVTHAGQRAAFQFLGIGASNIAKEFAPQLGPLAHKLHIPQVLPPWWVPNHSFSSHP